MMDTTLPISLDTREYKRFKKSKCTIEYFKGILKK